MSIESLTPERHPCTVEYVTHRLGARRALMAKRDALGRELSALAGRAWREAKGVDHDAIRHARRLLNSDKAIVDPAEALAAIEKAMSRL